MASTTGPVLAGSVLFFAAAAIPWFYPATAFATAGLLVLGYAVSVHFSTEFALTDPRIILKRGLLKTKIVSIRNPDEIHLSTGPFARLWWRLGFGTLRIRRSGRWFAIPMIQDSERFLEHTYALFPHAQTPA